MNDNWGYPNEYQIKNKMLTELNSLRGRMQVQPDLRLLKQTAPTHL